MVARPTGINGYEFAVVAALRAHQLMSGCIPRIEGEHKATTIAQMEVATGRISRVVASNIAASAGSR